MESGTTPTGSTRQVALERELAQLIRINSTVANLIETIKYTHSNIAKINESGNSTHTLLDQWVRILSQTNFTHDIINDRTWNGKEDQELEEEDDDLAQKEILEQQLLNQLSKLEAENSELSTKIETKEQEHEQARQRRNDILVQRKRELGLYTVSGRDATKRRR
ncbi:predicted protein [Scheffersomyces stipitis CBS 6054]|uniref:DASH complex subunit DUO1 n=1 Tax=Scheffersomyces stipitis (strain ATCC 58785 / CBS 6054 / NBRC 10063 / NRRL Y-11545) TaxID=322104 RepID=A3LYM7_PICST|nr:predicted protein [Scheffersomyces stipitis CBS 6054]ABN68000.1 predicted protein [Scheffersomyces stipitis CBS 6054]